MGQKTHRCAVDPARARVLDGIRRRMGARLASLHDPEDVLQDVHLRAIETGALGDSPAPGRERAWLLAAARLRILSLARELRARSRPRRATALPLSELQLVQERIHLVARTRDDGPEAHEEERLRKALSRLSRTERSSIVLRDYLGLSWRTTALILGMNVAASRKCHRRACDRLRRRVEGRET